MRVYLDNCVLNRPFDDQSQERIYFETQSFLILLKYVDEARVQIVNSFAIEYEISRMADIEIELKIREYLNATTEFVRFNDKIKRRALELEKLGFIGLDAMHISAAENAEVDYFVTCDSGILKSAVKHTGKLKVNIVSIATIVLEIIKDVEDN